MGNFFGQKLEENTSFQQKYHKLGSCDCQTLQMAVNAIMRPQGGVHQKYVINIFLGRAVSELRAFTSQGLPVFMDGRRCFIFT